MRQAAVKAVLAKARKAILVLPIYDDVTAEYDSICDKFDTMVDIGRHHDMIIRPTRHLLTIDGKEDYFCFSKNVTGCWLLTKGLKSETEKLALDARVLKWCNIRALTTRFSHYAPGIGRFTCTALGEKQSTTW